jgi:hypothetical protein
MSKDRHFNHYAYILREFKDFRRKTNVAFVEFYNKNQFLGESDPIACV